MPVPPPTVLACLCYPVTQFTQPLVDTQLYLLTEKWNHSRGTLHSIHYPCSLHSTVIDLVMILWCVLKASIVVKWMHTLSSCRQSCDWYVGEEEHSHITSSLSAGYPVFISLSPHSCLITITHALQSIQWALFSSHTSQGSSNSSVN